MFESDYNYEYDGCDGSKSDSDVWKDSSESVDMEVGSTARTFIQHLDADVDDNISNPFVEKFGDVYTKWDWLNQVHNGRTSQSRKEEKRYNDIRRDAKTFCSQLDMTEYQRERVLSLLDDVESFHHGQYRAEAVVFAAITLVANVDGWRIRNEDIFHKLRDERDVSSNQVREMRKQLRGLL